MSDSEMSARQMRYELLTLILSIKPSNTKASTIIKILDEYYNAIIEKDGEVVYFPVYED